jgi:hypothetical protein
VLPPALKCSEKPLPVNISYIFLSDFFRIGSPNLVNNKRSLNDTVLYRLCKRIVTNNPGIIRPVLIFGSGGEVQPQR